MLTNNHQRDTITSWQSLHTKKKIFFYATLTNVHSLEGCVENSSQIAIKLCYLSYYKLISILCHLYRSHLYTQLIMHVTLESPRNTQVPPDLTQSNSTLRYPPTSLSPTSTHKASRLTHIMTQPLCSTQLEDSPAAQIWNSEHSSVLRTFTSPNP